MNKIFNIFNKIRNTIINYSAYDKKHNMNNVNKKRFCYDRYDGYNFHDFMDKLSNEGAF